MDKIETQIELKAPLARVWRALTDHQEFGTWFRVKVDGPFVLGEARRGNDNDNGLTTQMKNIAAHVEAQP